MWCVVSGNLCHTLCVELPPPSPNLRVLSRAVASVEEDPFELNIASSGDAFVWSGVLYVEMLGWKLWGSLAGKPHFP